MKMKGGRRKRDGKGQVGLHPSVSDSWSTTSDEWHWRSDLVFCHSLTGRC